MNKYRVAILRGGLSDQFEQSMRTGQYVLEHIDTHFFEPHDIIIARNGEWLIDGRVRMPEYVLSTSDVVFNALHGTYGEDGVIQRLFTRHGIPFTGSEPYAAAISTHKVQTKNHLRHHGIKMPKHVEVSSNMKGDLGRMVRNIIDTFGPEYVIKPVSSGSSRGTMYVKNPLLLQQALSDALDTYESVMVEARIPGREATCCVVDGFRNSKMYTLPPVEIEVPHDSEFLSSKHKFSPDTQCHCPSRFDRATKNEIERIARLAHTELGLSQYSKSDFIIGDDGVYFLEINSLPQLHAFAPVTQSLHAVGSKPSEFISHLLFDALATPR